jgi:hypothetical protein
MKKKLFYLDSYVVQKDMRIRLPKAAAVNLGLECGKSVFNIYVDKDNGEIVLKLADENEGERVRV